MSAPEFAPELASPEAAPPEAPKPSRPSVATIVLLFLLSICGTLAAISFALRQREEPAQVTVVRPTPDVVTAIHDLARLESTSYHVERVIDLRDDQRVLFGSATASDAILLVAAGDVVAGVDLAKLRPEDVVVDAARSRVRIVLPEPEIFSARLDNDRTFVYRRETELLARRSETLETRARQEAERTMRASAIEGGILDRAATQSRVSIAAFVRALGYREVEVVRRGAER